MSTTTGRLRRRITSIALAVALGSATAATAGATTATASTATASAATVTTAAAGLPTASAIFAAGTIDPTQYRCQSPTAFDSYQETILAGVDMDNLGALAELGGIGIPSLYAMKFGATRAGALGFGADGGATKQMRRELADLARFWGLGGSVVAVPQKGKAVYDDVAGVALVLQDAPFDLSPAQALTRAQEIHRLINADPVLQGGDNPFFTLGAFTLPTGLMGHTGPTTIYFGDGIFRWLADAGLAPAGPQYVLAHEFAHVAQFETGHLNLDLSQQNPVDNRTSELMADAMASYYVAHRVGGHASSRALADVQAAAFAKGDCDFAWANHHGTPNQRQAAVRWGEAQASAIPRGRILSARDFIAAFNARLPDLVAPDAP